MSEATVAIIVAILGFLGTLISVFVSAKTTRDKLTNQINIEMAVIQTKMEQMDKKVEEHNEYAKMFHENIPVLKEQLKEVNRRLEKVEDEKP